MRLLLLIAALVPFVLSQYYMQQQVRPVMQPQQQRTMYYPVRTNCQNRCNQQTRYRWNVRPTNIRPNVQVQIRTLPSAPGPIRPVVNPVPVPLPTLPTPPPSTLPPITYPRTTAGVPITTPQTTTETTTQPPTTTTTLETPAPESTPSMAPSHTDPTPAPETTVAPTTKYLRPERKQTKAKYFNPCAVGQPLLNEFSTPISCNYLNQPNGGCPEDHFCHTGASFSTTACCPLISSEDRCAQRRDTGEGDELVARWYFDSQAKECRRFLYKGIRGNANNFVTKAQCVDACEAGTVTDETNPCKFSNAATFKNGSRIICGPNDDSMCPNGYYCHIGENPELTACCENSGLTDPCLLSINIGQGKALLKRFYYNTFSKRCTEFIYKGTKGNENNFLSYTQCQEKCQKWDNPCPVAVNYAQKKECGMESNNGTECSAGQWCHIGATKETSVCCPGASPDPCSLPMFSGEGTGNLTRWYADPADKSCSRQCKSFTYNGSKGNQNNFLTKQQCESKCKRECKNPCGSGTMLMTPTNEPRICSPSSPCPSSHWCHVGITPDTTVCCSAVQNTCELPMTRGYGNSHLTRWHFDKNLNKCVKFIYSGEGGNQNMFLTQEDCLSICPVFENPCGNGKPLLIGAKPKLCSPDERCPSTHFCHIGVEGSENYCCPKHGDPCQQSLATGTGGFSITRYYYDKETRRCRDFVYEGQKGNANNFLTLEDCGLVCPVLPNPCSMGEPLLSIQKEPVICGGEDTCPNGYYCHVGGAPETTNCCPGTRRPCDLSLEVGQGVEKLERWFFDGGIQMCRPFVYKGMKGNSNNFLTKQSCRQACKEMNPCGYGDPLVDTAGERILCTGGQRVDSCPTNSYCHVGSSALTTLCCPKRKIDPCDQAVEEGTGSEDLPRWFFDRKQNRCAPFTYGGVAGNENNFISQNTCMDACPEYRNYCPHGIPLIESSTVTSCGIDKGCPEGFICHMSSEFNVSICCQDPMDFCLSARDSGPCNNFEKRYGYDANTDTCVEYQYGGCEGTLNNFHSLQRCTEICCKEYKRRHRL
ncbi:hypothetical protein GCK72_023735 [Caenorhabditis remanei]|uniref:BPTI/Kunitz inhibitor domain-containing protein n=1 Tax=Caenorhabditis remanei TaxID=31234 RepID=A0A6A5FXJ2_CAERE|nr:hypothetical protein GCK72_023735 [Caenorhabditis remanei]KAF1747273.1 hypothetical protein GCK72_023735 [Caenorhabditis remanei]